MDELTESPPDNLSATDRLSERQKQCLSMVANGHTSKEIGRMLNLSPSTVDNHISIALERLGVDSRVAAARIFIRGNVGVRLGEIEVVADALTKNIPGGNDGQRLSATDQYHVSRSFFSIPVLGGRRNNLSQRRRFFHVVQIMLLALMAFSAVTITIAGIVHLFSK